MSLHLLQGWYWLTIGMVFCFLICISLMVIQRASFKWYSLLNNNNSVYKARLEHFCLYGQYLLASICSLQCLFNHISNHFPSWYCVYGMSICVIFHEGSKTFGYGFFLERAKSTINKTRISVLPPIITKYVLPIYISLYFVLYSILCPLEFRGLSIEPNNVPTACLFDEYESWVFYLSVGVEIFNSIFFVWLFAYPLYKIIGRSNSKNQNIEQLEVIKIVKYNIAFSSISCISSVTFLFYRAFARNNQLGHYLWLAGNIDLVINVICTFLMVTVNRKYIKYFCCQKKQKKNGKQKHNNDNKDNIQSDNMTVTNIECTSLLIQDQISNMTVTNIEVEGKDREMYESKNEQIQTFEPTVETHYAERTTTADRMKQNFTQISLF